MFEQNRQDNEPEPQQHSGRVVVPPQVIQVAVATIQLCKVVMDYLSEADWFHESLIEGTDSIPPNLEEFIPGERLPDIIDVYVTKEFLFRASGCFDYLNWSTSQLERPIKFVRQYPGRTIIDNDGPDRDCPKTLLTGQLDLRYSDTLGDGHHSRVFLAPLTFLSTTPGLSVRGAVAVKLSRRHHDARKMLLNEAKIYDAFPHDLQGGDVPVVPKFYGYYTPYIEESDWVNNENGSGNVDKDEWTRETMPKCMKTPILLLEACGKAVRTHSLSDSDRESIGMLLERLHEAKFVQKSMFRRNIVVQPGPLSVPRANRSLDEPSYRIIDFGRGTGLGVNIFSLQDLRREAESEQHDARAQRLTILSSSSTPFNMPSGSSPPLKRKLSSASLSAQSSSSSKRRKTLIEQIVGALIEIGDLLSTWREPPAPAPAPAPAPLSDTQVQAVKQFHDSFWVSKVGGDEWLSSDDVARVTKVFLQETSVAQLYLLLLTESPRESITRSWVRNDVLQRG